MIEYFTQDGKKKQDLLKFYYLLKITNSYNYLKLDAFENMTVIVACGLSLEKNLLLLL